MAPLIIPTNPSADIYQLISSLSYTKLAYLLEQQWLQGWVQLLAHILQQHGQTKLNGILQHTQVLTTLAQLDHLHSEQYEGTDVCMWSWLI